MTELEDAIAQALQSNAEIFQGRALRLGNAGSAIDVQVPGRNATVRCYCATEVNSATVSVVFTEQGAIAFCGTAPQSGISRTTQFLHVLPFGTPSVGGKIKYLFSVVQGGATVFYVGGWRKGKTQQVSPSLPNVSVVLAASIDNLGGDKWTVNFAYRCTGDSAQTLHIEKTGSSGLVWRVTITLSQASSSFSPTITGSPVTEQPPTHVSHGFWYQPAARTVIEIHNIFDETGLLYSYFAAIETIKHNVFDGVINSAVQPAGVQGVFHPEITPNTLHTPVVRLPSTNFATPVSDDRTFTFASTGSLNLPFINLAIDVSGNYGLGLDRITSALRWSTLTGYTESTAAYTAIVVGTGVSIWYDATSSGFSTIKQTSTITGVGALNQDLKDFQVQTYNTDFSASSTVTTTVYGHSLSGYTLYNASYHA